MTGSEEASEKVRALAVDRQKGVCLDPDDVLRCLVGYMEDVVVIGIDKDDGEVCLCTSFGRIQDACFTLRQGEMMLLESQSGPNDVIVPRHAHTGRKGVPKLVGKVGE